MTDIKQKCLGSLTLRALAPLPVVQIASRLRCSLLRLARFLLAHLARAEVLTRAHVSADVLRALGVDSSSARIPRVHVVLDVAVVKARS